jgi:hypothetical protein
MEAHRVERRRRSHIFEENRLINGGEVVSLRRRPRFNQPPPGRFLELICVKRLSKPQGYSAAGMNQNSFLGTMFKKQTPIKHNIKIFREGGSVVRQSQLCLRVGNEAGSTAGTREQRRG